MAGATPDPICKTIGSPATGVIDVMITMRMKEEVEIGISDDGYYLVSLEP